MLTEGEINKALAVRRMNKDIELLREHIIICGYGRIGQLLARKLSQTNQLFVIIGDIPKFAQRYSMKRERRYRGASF